MTTRFAPAPFSAKEISQVVHLAIVHHGGHHHSPVPKRGDLFPAALRMIVHLAGKQGNAVAALRELEREFAALEETLPVELL